MAKKPLNIEHPCDINNRTPVVNIPDGQWISGSEGVFRYQQGIRLLNQANLLVTKVNVDCDKGGSAEFDTQTKLRGELYNSRLVLFGGGNWSPEIIYNIPLGFNFSRLLEHGNKLYLPAKEIANSVDGKLTVIDEQDNTFFQFRSKYCKKDEFGLLPSALYNLEQHARKYSRKEKEYQAALTAPIHE